jgi:hypothetical protein
MHVRCKSANVRPCKGSIAATAGSHAVSALLAAVVGADDDPAEPAQRLAPAFLAQILASLRPMNRAGDDGFSRFGIAIAYSGATIGRRCAMPR